MNKEIFTKSLSSTYFCLISNKLLDITYIISILIKLNQNKFNELIIINSLENFKGVNNV